MDADWQPLQGSNPAAGADPNAPATADGGDWRAQLDPESRSWIVSRIFEVLKRHLPVSVPEGVNELQKIAVRFEEKIYTAATSQPDYMRKISLKMLSMETKSEQAPGNAQAQAGAGTFSISVLSRPKQYTQIADPNHERQLAASAGVQLPAGIDPNPPAPAGDWRTQLDPESRSSIVFQIVETLKKHLPVSVPERLNELKKIAVRFEEKIYTAATSQPDYMRKISMKMLSMDTRIQQAPGNAQVIPYQYYPN